MKYLSASLFNKKPHTVTSDIPISSQPHTVTSDIPSSSQPHTVTSEIPSSSQPVDPSPTALRGRPK